MIEGLVGGAAFSNELGRPGPLGCFHTFEEKFDGQVHGYHRPTMVVDSLGSIQTQQTYKEEVPEGALLTQPGDPGMLISSDGDMASSMSTGTNSASSDFSSVQRDNPETEHHT